MYTVHRTMMLEDEWNYEIFMNSELTSLIVQTELHVTDK